MRDYNIDSKINFVDLSLSYFPILVTHLVIFYEGSLPNLAYFYKSLLTSLKVFSRSIVFFRSSSTKSFFLRSSAFCSSRFWKIIPPKFTSKCYFNSFNFKHIYMLQLYETILQYPKATFKYIRIIFWNQIVF